MPAVRPPKPDPLPCPCGADGYIYWSSRGTGSGYRNWAAGKEGYWCRQALCSRCRGIRKSHGMTGAEYDAYLAQGCAIPACDRPAVNIDHDHSICPRPRGDTHTCPRCRRGPLCHYHNTNVIRLLDALGNGEFTEELKYAGLQIRIKKVAMAGKSSAQSGGPGRGDKGGSASSKNGPGTKTSGWATKSPPKGSGK